MLAFSISSILMHQKPQVFECRRKISQKFRGIFGAQKSSIFASYDFSGMQKIENFLQALESHFE
jgi:hypothetical protein